MISLSYHGMRRLVEKLSESHDAAVLEWSDTLEKNLKVFMQLYIYMYFKW